MSNPTPQNSSSRRRLREYAITLAKNHRDEDDDQTDIYVDWRHGEVRLIEVADHYPNSQEVLPFHFSADPDLGFDYPAVILMHGREAWESVENKTGLLPDGWSFEDFQHLEELS